MRILHQFKLMTSNGLADHLFALEKITGGYSATYGKVFNEPPVGLERTNEYM